jgi:hypothetical protein
MATFSDDFSSHTVGTTADVSTPNAITGWNGQFPAGSSGFAEAEVISGSTPLGDRFLRISDTGWGFNKALYPSSIGSVGASTATHILCLWRTDAGLTVSTTPTYAPGFIRQNTSNLGYRYQVGLTKSGSTESHALWYVRDADEWTPVGSSKDVSTDFVPGEWWWHELKVSASGGWLWRTWEYGTTKPTDWQNAEATDTSEGSGYCGIGMWGAVPAVDFAWFSAGTGSDAAPEPSSTTLDQEGFAWGDDDGSESTHTIGTQEANLTAPTGVNKILRALLNATGDPAGAAYTLRAQKNGSGGYVAVPVGPGNAETYAQPTWGAVGTAASGTTSCAPAYPTGISASTSKLFCLVTGRSNTANTVPTMPAGWTRIGGLEGGTGTWGVDTGTRRVDFFQKDTVLGTETGTVTVSLAGTTANTLRASIFRVEVTSGYGIDVALVSGADTTNDTSYSAAASASATFDSNRLVLVGVAQNIDSGTNSAQSISASGITFGTLTSRANTAVTNGNDHRHLLWSVPVSSGSGTVAPTFVYTISAAGSGPTAFLVLRGRLPALTNELYIAPSSNITAGGEATTARLTPPSGKTTSDFVAGRRWDDENGADSLDITADDYTEVGWCLQSQSPATNGDYWDFRVYAGASPLDTYSVTPRWTIGTPAAPDYPFGSRATYLDPDPDLGYALAEWREPEQFFAPQWREIGPDIRTTSVSGRLRVGSADSTAKTGAADMLGRLGARGQGAAEKSIATDVAGTLRPRGTDAAGKFAAHDQAGRLRAAGGDDTAKRGQNDQAGRLAQQGAVLTLKVGGTSIAGAFSARGAAAAAKTGGADQNGRLHLRGATSFTPAGSASTDVSARLRLIGSASAGKTGTADQAGVARLRGASTFTVSGVGSTDVSALLRLRGSSSAAKLSGTATQGQLAGRGAAAGAKIGAGTAAGRVDARGAEDAAKIGITSVAARMAPLSSSSYSREGSGATAVAGAVRLFGATNAVKIGGTVIAGRLSVRGNMQTAVDFALDLRYVVRALRRGWDARRLGAWDARRLGSWDARERRE